MFIVTAEEAGVRLDQYLTARLPNFSRSRVQAVVRAGEVLLNRLPAKMGQKLRVGDELVWHEPAPEACETAEPSDIPLNILFEDQYLLVINKATGLVVHPGAGHRQGTLVSALLHHCGTLSQLGGAERPGIVHRLDRETSGCLVVAKADEVHRHLSAQFAGREVKKTYLALVEGGPRLRNGTVNAAIGRHKTHRQKMAVCEPERGREAVTDYRVIASNNGRSLVECRPRTGRTHQIRVHMKHLGCPVLGDPLYGKRGNFHRHMLHAWKLSFRHPVTGREMNFEAPAPEEFVALEPAAGRPTMSRL